MTKKLTNSHAGIGPSQDCLPPQMNDHLQSRPTHLVVFVHACGYYLRAATIWDVASI